jgi:Peptidase family M48
MTSVWFARGVIQFLAWFTILNAGSWVIAALMARNLGQQKTPGAAALWLGLRVFASAAASVFVVAFFLPSYWMFEPQHVNEPLAKLLMLSALITCVSVAVGVVRGVSAWRSAARRTRAWMRNARPISLPGTTLPAFEADVDTPVLALVGIVRSRLLVTRGLIAALSPDELAAAVAHEVDHARSRDNLARLVMGSLPDVLPTTSSIRTIEHRWVIASEHRADRAVAAHDPRARLELASALVKIARLMPPVPSIFEPISAMIGDGDVASRVRRLLDDRAAAVPPRPVRRSGWLIALVAAVVLVAAYGPLLECVHDTTEVLVEHLP